MSVTTLLATTPSRELTEWEAYERVYGPLGPVRADVHAAMITRMLAQVMSDGKRTFDLDDFLPQWDNGPADEPVQTWQEQKSWLQAFTAAHGGEVGVGGDSAESADPDRG